MLVWDSFKCRISDERKEQLKQYNTVMSVIPGGCTKYLQPFAFASTNCSNHSFVDATNGFAEANSITFQAKKSRHPLMSGMGKNFKRRCDTFV